MQPNLDKYLRETGSADFKIEKLSDALSIDTIVICHFIIGRF